MPGPQPCYARRQRAEPFRPAPRPPPLMGRLLSRASPAQKAPLLGVTPRCAGRCRGATEGSGPEGLAELARPEGSRRALRYHPSTGSHPPTSWTLPACFAATSPDGEAPLAGSAHAKKRPPCQRGLAALAAWGIPTGFPPPPRHPFAAQSTPSLSQNFTNFTRSTQNLPTLCKTFTAIVPYYGRNRRKTAVQLACFR